MRNSLLVSIAFVLFASSAQAERIEYEYDAHGRLVKVKRCGSDNVCDGDPDDVDTDYTYDNVDNRTEKKVTVDPPP